MLSRMKIAEITDVSSLFSTKEWFCYQNCSDLLWEKNILDSFLHPTIKAAFGDIFLCPTIKTASGNILPLKGFCCAKNIKGMPRPLLFLNAHGAKVKINTGSPLIVRFLGPRKNRSNGNSYY